MELVAVPNFSVGGDDAVLDAIGAAFGAAETRVLDVHRDADHGRAVFTVTGPPGHLGPAMAAALAAALAAGLDVTQHEGLHPHVGALDVAPVVFRRPEQRGEAIAEALLAADAIARLAVPVLLYGLLGGGRTRAHARKNGPQGLARRMAAGEITADFGPAGLHPQAGAALVAARPPLIAFNVELEQGATERDAQRIAALIREGGQEGLEGVRAIGLALSERGGAVQVSTNIEDFRATTPAQVVAAVARHAAVAEAELVGLPPQEALRDFPTDLPLGNRRTLEEALA